MKGSSTLVTRYANDTQTGVRCTRSPGGNERSCANEAAGAGVRSYAYLLHVSYMYAVTKETICFVFAVAGFCFCPRSLNCQMVLHERITRCLLGSH